MRKELASPQSIGLCRSEEGAWTKLVLLGRGKRKMDTLQANNSAHSNTSFKFFYYYFYFFKKILLKTLLFSISFRLRTKLRGWYKDFPCIPFHHTCIASSIINIPHQNGTICYNWWTYELTIVQVMDTSLSPKICSLH